MSESCPNCGCAVIDAASFCGECGHSLGSIPRPAPLQVECPDCGWPNTPAATSCSQCRFPLAGNGQVGAESNSEAGEVEPVIDPVTGDLLMRTVCGNDDALSAPVFELISQLAPLVAQRILESPGRDWGWPAEKLAEIDPGAVILQTVKCYHGQGHKGWLVATLDQVWWLEKGLFLSAEQPLSYAWDIEASKQSILASSAGLGAGLPVGINARRGVLDIGGDLFQMHSSEIDDFGLFMRQMQVALSRTDEIASSADPAPMAPSVAQTVSPAVRLKELAELRDLGILSEDEFQSKKAELLAKEW